MLILVHSGSNAAKKNQRIVSPMFNNLCLHGVDRK